MLHCGMSRIALGGMSVKAFHGTSTSSTKAYGVTQERRRSANYKPNIWTFQFLQSLTSNYTDVVYKTCTKKLVQEFMHSLSDEQELSTEHIIDNISKLGLSSVFTEFIKDDVVNAIPTYTMNKTSCFKEDILKASLNLMLLLQQGYDISRELLDQNVGYDVIRGVRKLFEASHLSIEGEETLTKEKTLCYKNLIECDKYLHNNLSQQITQVSKGPCHFGVSWFDVVHNIRAYEQVQGNNKILIELAKLNFNMTQAMHVEELKELSRWWNNIGLTESIDFARDRLLESFFLAVGIAYEPQYALIRKCLTKVITLVLVIDDLYDIYGTLDELNSFSTSVERWDAQEMQQLPECIKICFSALQRTTSEIADEIQKEKRCGDDISFFLNTAWADFCKALLTEARWYNTKHIPSVDEYLRTASMTSSGPLLSLVTILCTVDGGSGVLKDKLLECQDLVYYISIIIRLSNDLGTSTAELERGDSPSAILCFMVEANVTEEMARIHVKKIISDTWKKIYKELLLSASLKQQTCVNLIINIARACQFIYRQGDGFSASNKDIRNQITKILIEPIRLSIGPGIMKPEKRY